MILYTCLEVKIPVFPRRTISKWIKSVAEHYKRRVGEVSFIFCSESKILEINKVYLSHDYFTDIITFDYSSKETISGDIFISPDTIKSNADKYKVNFMNELYRVMIHGILHLCEMRDKTKKEKAIMREIENKALEILQEYLQ